MTTAEADLVHHVLASFQRIEGEMVEVRRRLLWLKPGAAPAADQHGALDSRREATVPFRPRLTGSHGVHTPRGPAASARVLALQKRLGVNAPQLARLLGITSAMVYMIERGINGISKRLHPRLVTLEQGPVRRAR